MQTYFAVQELHIKQHDGELGTEKQVVNERNAILLSHFLQMELQYAIVCLC